MFLILWRFHSGTAGFPSGFHPAWRRNSRSFPCHSLKPRLHGPNGHSYRAASESQGRHHVFDHLYMFVLFILQFFEQFLYHFDLTPLCGPGVECTGLKLLVQCGVQYLIRSAQTSIAPHVISLRYSPCPNISYASLPYSVATFPMKYSQAFRNKKSRGIFPSFWVLTSKNVLTFVA